MTHRPVLLSLSLLLPLKADPLIGPATGNGAFISSASEFNGSPDGWTASPGVWMDSGNSTLGSSPFGPDTATHSRFLQIHNDAGGTLTSNVTFSVQPGDEIRLFFDFKTGGSGAHTTLTVSLWDSLANTTYATLGSLSTAHPQSGFVTTEFSHQATVARSHLRLRFSLTAGGRDFHIDRVHLAGGVVVPPSPPAPIEYATVQHLLPEDTDARIVEKAAKLLPHPRQVAWQRLETTFFIHYGPNAFTGREWGTGFESPAIFNPTALDAEQWVREIDAAGGRMVMLVVKHHDGFCLWPSRYTHHDVASSPWLGGNGDLVRLVAEACAARGIAFGVYLSPADLYQIESAPGFGAGLYGNGSAVLPSVIPTDPAVFRTTPTVGRNPPDGFPVLSATVDDYNRYFLNQLYELLTEYGPIAEVWFDGATPKQTNPPQPYDRQAWYALIRSLRPDAVIAIKGPDCRWVGNESGFARETEWSPLPIPKHPDQHTWDDMTASDLGSRSRLTRGSHLTWYPAETDVPILHGWFWAPGKSVRSTAELIDIHYTSVGRNSNLLLNLSPDNRGLIPDNQLTPLRSMAQVIRNTFATDLAQGSSGGPAAWFDGNPDTFAEAPEGQSTAEWSFDLAGPRSFDVICLQEPIAQRGQRIEGFAVDAWNGANWIQQAAATTVGSKRLLRLASPVTTDRVRIRITACRLNPSLATVSLHKQAVSTAAPVIGGRGADGLVSLSHPEGRPIRYTLDGSAPGPSSLPYSAPLHLPLGGNLRAVGIGTDGLAGMETRRDFPGIASTGWTADADEETQAAALAIDGDPATHWAATGSAMPHWLRIDMGAPRWIGGFSYLPPAAGGAGTATSYRFETSDDGLEWTARAEGGFGNMANNPVRQDVSFGAVKARWFRFIPLSEVSLGSAASVAEISVIAAGFDAWKRDLGQPLLLPGDPFPGGGDAITRYVFGTPEPIVSAQQTAAGQLSLRVRTRAGLPDVLPLLRISPDLREWTAAPEADLTPTEASEGWQETEWLVRFPEEWTAGFARAVFQIQ